MHNLEHKSPRSVWIEAKVVRGQLSPRTKSYVETMAFIITWKWYGSRSSLIIGSQFWLTVRGLEPKSGALIGPRSQVTMGFSVSGLVRHKSDVNEGRSIWIRALPGIVILR
ncbi:hypothetical protein M747DRAFT_310018 [Aspergillus niger ATCC 13496]|uniref:Uncharacterized protein n=1 Tax=Aspergillus niger ATCC 13496 TaxID=1353008 RepID=A0A370BIX2_ASPNG|nr:hypothetical protein M747DRAFT_310018 [Aspergillus niger ATCC 13496]